MVGRRPGIDADRFPRRPLGEGTIDTRLRQALGEDWDFTSGKILGSMCTEPLPKAVEAANLFPTSNLGNPGLCPGTSRLEEEVIAMLLNLYHGPRFGAGGHVVTGGTEANLTALWVARNMTGANQVILPQSAHFSFVKAVDLLAMEPRWIRVGADGRMDLTRVRKAMNRRTAAIVGVAGTTELGAVDPIRDLSRVAVDEGIRLHVDAAFGGFVIPFLKGRGTEQLEFDFGLEGVTSIATDPHKMGMAPVPSGVLLVRQVDELKAIAVGSPYLSDPVATSLLGTRPSRNVAATFAAIASMGREGYERSVRRVMLMTRTIAQEGRRMGLKTVIEPTMNVIAFHHSNPSYVQDEMLRQGWDLSAVRSPPAIRMVVMPHLTMKSIRAMLKDLGKVLRTECNTPIGRARANRNDIGLRSRAAVSSSYPGGDGASRS